MNIIDFILKFPEIKEKDEKYYFFLGIVSGLNSKEFLAILDTCLIQDIFKRKILINKASASAPIWKISDNDDLFKKVYSVIDSLDSYFKKESASMILVAVLSYISKSNQYKLLNYFLQSKYTNNRKRAYEYLLNKWSPEYLKVVEKAWQDYEDYSIINLLINKTPKEFLVDNREKISSYFNEDNLEYDFRLKILRNMFYARIFDEIPSVIRKLKNDDPISFIFIMKECNKKIEPTWAIEIYKKFPRSRFLSRWYAEMGLWKEILKIEQNFFNN